MKRVDFYVMQNFEFVWELTCRLTEKAYAQQLSTHIQVPSLPEAKKIDTLLWTFKEVSFLPHEIWQEKTVCALPISIGYFSTSPKRDLLINLTLEIPPFYTSFERLIEFVPPDETAKQKAREKYQYFRQEQWHVNSHQV